MRVQLGGCKQGSFEDGLSWETKQQYLLVNIANIHWPHDERTTCSRH